jgi:hypothetical protein
MTSSTQASAFNFAANAGSAMTNARISKNGKGKDATLDGCLDPAQDAQFILTGQGSSLDPLGLAPTQTCAKGQPSGLPSFVCCA